MNAPWPQFDEEMADSAARVVRSGKVNYWTGGEGRAFERECAAFLGVPASVAVANGTLALELALQALGVGPGDEVVVTPRSFVASVSCVVARGARPVFADVEREGGNLTAESIRAVLTPRTRAVIPVHLAGRACEMDPILELARERGLKVIEDVAQATGGTYRGRALGTLGDVGAFSFCQDKILTTAGEGGLLVARDPALLERLWSLKDHGKSYDAVHRRKHPPGFRWLHEDFGTNARMTEVQAAVGRVALRRLPGWLEARRRNAARLTAALEGVPGLRIPSVPAHVGHAWYKYYVYVGSGRDRVLAALEKAGVPAFSGSCSEIYLEKAFEKPGLRPEGRLAVAKELGETSLMFLIDPTVSPEALDLAAAGLRTALASTS